MEFLSSYFNFSFLFIRPHFCFFLLDPNSVFLFLSLVRGRFGMSGDGAFDPLMIVESIPLLSPCSTSVPGTRRLLSCFAHFTFFFFDPYFSSSVFHPAPHHQQAHSPRSLKYVLWFVGDLAELPVVFVSVCGCFLLVVLCYKTHFLFLQFSPNIVSSIYASISSHFCVVLCNIHLP